MYASHADISNALDRILNAAADNLRFAKILVQLGLDPNNITYDALFNRLLEIVLANITLANMCALVGAVLALVAHAMIPVALEEGGSLVVLPTVAGFLFALYLALSESFV